MKITFITLFPEIFQPILNASILKRAQKKGLLEFELINLRDFGIGAHKSVDDKSYGGGVGMVLKPDVLANTLRSALDINKKQPLGKFKIVLTSASGHTFNQQKAKQLSKLKHLVLICGHYEGIDQRFIDKYVDEEISIGDYVLTGGELPAMVIADSITRLIKGVLEKEEAIKNESFENNLLEYPHYTRPENFEGLNVPKVLLSGNHAQIETWRHEKAVEKTKKVRPDLLNLS